MAALVLVAHGSLNNPESSAPCYAHAARIRSMGLFAQVLVGFWKEEPSLSRVLAGVREPQTYVVPWFMSEGYFSTRVVPRELHAHGPWPTDVVLCDVVGTHPDMTEAIEAQALEALEPEGDADRAALVIVGHGTLRHKRSSESIVRQVSRIRARGRFQEVEAAFLDEPPYIRDIGTLITARQVVVVPMFTADGYHTRDQIPTYLGLAPEGGADLPLSGEVQGRRIWCTHAVGLQPRMVDVILDRVKSAGWSMPDTPIHPRPMPPGGELLFEAQRDAEAWSWGQVAVVQNGQGFMLHRVGDSAPHELLGDREALRLWCRHDAHGQYRSLASAPTLRGGWCMGPLDVREAAWALETIYPGRMMAWARLLGCAKPRERVWPLRHVAMRHTGMLAGVQEQDSARLTSVMAHVCGGCLCTRLWDVDSVAEPWDELFLSVVTAPKLPCLEPCAPLLEDAAQEQ